MISTNEREQIILQERAKYNRLIALMWVVIVGQGIGFVLAFLAVFQTPDASTSNLIIAGFFLLIGGIAVQGVQDMPALTLADEKRIREA